MFDFSGRIQKVQKTLLTGDALWISQKEEVFYLSGFTGDDTVLVVMKDRLFFITDKRYTEQLRYEVSIPYELLLVESGRGRRECLLQLIKDHRIERLFVDKASFPLALYEYLVRQVPSLELSETRVVKDMRMVKDAVEIEVMKQNLMITEWGYAYIIRKTKPGKKEEELATELEYFLKKKGAKAFSFEPIVASGYRTTLPHGTASSRVIEKGEVVMFDFGILKNGYCSDFTRCFSPFKIKKPKILEIRRIVEQALRAAEEVVKPGVTAETVHQAAYRVIADAGYAENFWHSTGHGVGVEIHEDPYLRFGNTQILQEGMIFTVEPGIYLPDEGFGIRLEDMVLVRKNGAEVLTQTDYKL
ncbi:M24 family metallopeptidase [Thermospira aquatica]|uniref:Aminopeptidase P family protein n=1 Tax=Thermospira aquatica TaxID=2828656 RepID=A0AAX3BCQ0_9SPIR|nr:aminopeptidase P family protein [Thermospira aquatica]URA10041.1 aminopeptidase P family protein [Thermospira aquatica]